MKARLVAVDLVTSALIGAAHATQSPDSGSTHDSPRAVQLEDEFAIADLQRFKTSLGARVVRPWMARAKL